MCPNSVKYAHHTIHTTNLVLMQFIQDPPNLMDSGSAPDLPARPTTVAPRSPSPPPVAPSPDAATVNEQARMLKQYEDQQAALQAAREAEERRRYELEQQQQHEFEQRQREQAERERLAQEQLMQQQMMQLNNQAAQHVNDMERDMLAMRGQYERDQLLLEQYDRVCVFSILPSGLVCSHYSIIEGEGLGRRTGCRLHAHRLSSGIERRAHQATTRPSRLVAQQVRSPRQAVQSAPHGTSGHALKVQAIPAQSQLGAGGCRSHGTYGA